MSTPVAVEAKLGMVAVKVLAAVAIVGAAWAYGHHVGYTGEKKAYDLYVAQQAKVAESQVAANKAALLFQQTQFSLAQDKLQKDHQNAIDTLTASRDAAVADGANYADRLRYYLAHPSVRTVVVSGASSGTGQSAADSQGAGGLPDGVSDLNRYLTQRFYAADVNATTLNEAIDLIAQDRATCNGYLPGVTTK